MKIILSLVLTLFFTTAALLGTVSPVMAQKVFTAQELKQYDGKNGQPAYYAYEGKVYDVTKSELWKQGEHYGLQAGQDLTGKMEGAPHGTDVFAGFPVMGTYASSDASAAPVQASVKPSEQPVQTTQPATKKWYESRIRLAGISILGWTGILLGVLFVLNFATCFALPWSQFPLPWKGNRPGADPLDATPTHMRWTMLHKYFAWGTVIVGLIHGVLGLLQILFGLYL